MINLTLILPIILSYICVTYANHSDLGGLLSVRQVTNAVNFYESGVKQLDESIKILEDAKSTGNSILTDCTQTVQYVAVHVGPSGSFIKFAPIIKNLIIKIDKLTIALNEALTHLDPFINKLMSEKTGLANNKNIISQVSHENISNLSTESSRNLLIHIKKSLRELEVGESNSRKLNTVALRISDEVGHAIRNTNSALNILLGYRVTFTLVIDSENILSNSEKHKISIFSHLKLCHGTTNEVLNLQHTAKTLFEKSVSEGLLNDDINAAKTYISKIDSYAVESNKLSSEMSAKNEAMVSSIQLISHDIDKLKRILDDYKKSPHSAYKRMDVIHIEIDEIYESIGVALKWANAAVQSNFSILTAAREALQALEMLLENSRKAHSIRSTNATQLDDNSIPGAHGTSSTDKHDLNYLNHNAYGANYVTHNGYGSSGNTQYINSYGKYGSTNHSSSESDEDCVNHKCCKGCKKKKKPWYKNLGIGTLFSGIQNVLGLSGSQEYSNGDQHPNIPNYNYYPPSTRPYIDSNKHIENINPIHYPQDPIQPVQPVQPLQPSYPGNGLKEPTENVTEANPNELEDKTTGTDESIGDETNKPDSTTTTPEGTSNVTPPDQAAGGGNPIATTNHPTNPQYPHNPPVNPINPQYPQYPHNPANPHSNPHNLPDLPNVNLNLKDWFKIQTNLFGNQWNSGNLQMLQQDPVISELIIKGKEFLELFNAVKMKLMSGPTSFNKKTTPLSTLCYNFNQNRYYYENQTNRHN